MQARIVGLFLPTLLLVTAILGFLLSREMAISTSVHAQLERREQFDELLDVISEGTTEQLTSLSQELKSDPHRMVLLLGPKTFPGFRNEPSPLQQGRIDGALQADQNIWPWVDGDFTLTATQELTTGPVEVVYLVSSDPIQAEASRRATLVGVSTLTVMLFLTGAAYPLVRWALRPVHDLDRQAQALAAGKLDARAKVAGGAREIQQLGDSFNTMAEQVATSMHRERAFVASASHHLGNLMTPLRIRLESLDRNDPSVEVTLAELDRLESVVERLVQLNKSEEQEDKPIRLDIGMLVNESIQIWELTTQHLDIELRREGSRSAMAWAVPGAVEEVLDNLLDNAIKYCEGAPITVRVVRGLSNIRLVVADRGPGMNEGDIERAQGRFWRGSGQQNKPGSGLGLAIVDALALRCGGRFELRSPAGGGLEAALILQRAPDDQFPG